MVTRQIESGSDQGANGLSMKLSVMMFLQFAIWGAWWVPLGTYLSTLGMDDSIASIYSTQGWAAIASPILIGAIADRFVSAEKLLALLNLAGAILLGVMSTITDNVSTFFTLTLLYMLCFMPTLGLTTAIALRHLSDGQKQFPRVRVLGTIGWIVMGWTVSLLAAEKTATPIQLAAVLSLVFAVFALFLPKTPPLGQAKGIGALFGLSLFRSIKDPQFWLFSLAALLIYIPLTYYYSYTNLFLTQSGIEKAAAVQTIGQISEIAFMLCLPWALARFGIKWVLLAGMLAWALRYVAFSMGSPPEPTMALLILGLVLHGICFDFFFVAGQIYTDDCVPEDERATAQAFFSVVTFGIGTVVGSQIAGWGLEQNKAVDGTIDWASLWTMPAILAAATALIFAMVFRGKLSTRAATTVH
jgi:nucleoside transporter